MANTMSHNCFSDAYSNALFKANEIHALTVSFPCISTGVYGFPHQKAVEIAIGTILYMLPSI